jgi:N utilization substance protein B
MRAAIVELSGGEVPANVVLDEAIEIGREYGGGDSPRFINGVLDAVFQGIGAELGKNG